MKLEKVVSFSGKNERLLLFSGVVVPSMYGFDSFPLPANTYVKTCPACRDKVSRNFFFLFINPRRVEFGQYSLSKFNKLLDDASRVH